MKPRAGIPAAAGNFFGFGTQVPWACLSELFSAGWRLSQVVHSCTAAGLRRRPAGTRKVTTGVYVGDTPESWSFDSGRFCWYSHHSRII